MKVVHSPTSGYSSADFAQFDFDFDFPSWAATPMGVKTQSHN